MSLRSMVILTGTKAADDYCGNEIDESFREDGIG